MRWTAQPGDANSVAAGVDGAVFALPRSNPEQLAQWTRSGWKNVAQHPSNLAQVTVGSQSQVWTRDSGNGVHQLTQSGLQAVPLVDSAVHVAANYDGTVWSCVWHAIRHTSRWSTTTRLLNHVSPSRYGLTRT
jgi:hypothetical protein